MNPAQQDALSTLAKTLLAAGAVGGVGRAAFGVKDLLADNAEPEPTSPEPQVLDIPYRPRKKVPPKTMLPDGQAKLGSGYGSPSHYFGAEATSADQVPATTLATFLGAPAAAYLGWRGTDALLNNRRKAKLQSQLDDAKKDLSDAERSSLEPRELPNMKAASDVVQQLLDSPILNKMAEKCAFMGLDPLLSGVERYAPLVMAGAAIPAGVMGYNYARNSDPEYLRAKAIAKQIKEDRLNRSGGLAARLVPVGDDDQPLSEDEKKKEPERLAPKEAADELEKMAKAFVDKLIGR